MYVCVCVCVCVGVDRCVLKCKCLQMLQALDLNRDDVTVRDPYWLRTAQDCQSHSQHKGYLSQRDKGQGIRDKDRR